MRMLRLIILLAMVVAGPGISSDLAHAQVVNSTKNPSQIAILTGIPRTWRRNSVWDWGRTAWPLMEPTSGSQTTLVTP
jgi:hypothetical protein